MLAEIIKITIPFDLSLFALIVVVGIPTIGILVACIFWCHDICFPAKKSENNDKYGVENELRKQIATLVSNSNDKYGPKINADNFKPILGQGEKSAPMPGVSRPSNPRQLLSYEEVVAAYSGGVDRCLCTGAYSVLLNPKTDTCSVCDNKGTIQGRQCSCQVVKYWRNKLFPVFSGNCYYNCPICNDKGTIKGRQCSCKLVKYWRNKCSKA